MITITLPDGSRREYPAPLTVAEVAASIGAGLAKAALAGRVGQGAAARIGAMQVVRGVTTMMPFPILVRFRVDRIVGHRPDASG